MPISALNNETELLARISNRDESAFKVIYELYRAQVFTFALKYLRSTLQAEELVQEVFLKLWKLEKRLLEINDLENYILTLSRNKSFSMLRRMKLEAKNIEPLADYQDFPINDTEEEILLNDARQLLNKGILLLPPKQKLVYELCHQEGLKYDQAAKILNVSPETIKTHMKLALRFLRHYLSKNTDMAILLILFRLH
ncbi:RNA polymerase sigma factor [Pedobacter hiemivivus]|uniref:Sigma-70 family RNA polymerase sigma factor n=1 Tax=Pedobacter hiemivivus TaxID=2530454 RepID=A0A4R0NDJ9_9SPHI|nr:sigma-70 family RNA polymerase sigma factor [Pedobacter hiemivivus]TCC98460.1 sigma-70 family RNA polymerase sigma factor [Pedobacter hiemivivus]